MLPPQHRLRRSEDFSGAVRGGARSGSRRLVVHLAPGPSGSAEVARAGFVVSKAVGGAVQRNQVKRRLRGVVAARLGHLRQGDVIVVRALPAALDATSEDLGRDLDEALRGARRRLARAIGAEQR
ncbi:ribonuclease P protein component [Georgenia wangjunii]|uniref:ribonuclease P protein component n=1 Tax=Georgenia wangjunii TaxID=3117730 RepID=UPI002F2604DC